MEPQHRPDVFFTVSVHQSLLVVRIHEECEHKSLNSDRRLYAVWYISFVRLRIEIAHVLTGSGLMCHEIEIRS